MLYQITNGQIAYGDKLIIKDLNFEIRNTEKIAIVGRNGCGKTTLLKAITGEVPLELQENGNVSKLGTVEIGYLKQMTFEDDQITLAEEIRKVFAPLLQMKQRMEELLAALENAPSEEQVSEYSTLEARFNYLGGYHYEKDYAMILNRFGFSEEDERKRLSEFSGGQRTKIAFIKLLLSKPDILLLDEPTNHLDIATISWLEGYLKEYPRAVVVVSHDRMFLDRIADVVYEIEKTRIKRYVGNYTEFTKRKKQEYAKQLKEYEAQQKEIARLYEIVEKFKNTPTKVAMTRSKLKQIEHMELIEKPESFDERAFITSLVPAVESGNDVLETKQLAVGYEEILQRVTLAMKKGQKIGVIGGNGLGKSTFLKTLMGLVPKKGGTYAFGHNVELGYFDQQMAQYQSEKQVIDEFWDEFPTLTQTEVRNILGGFLFRGDEVFKKVSSLSGGEKVRLALARLFETRPNFLILDEPTNHMDLIGKEALEEMLKAYTGSVLFVSHDRYFVKQIADSLLIFQEGECTYFPFGYEAYEEKYGMEPASKDTQQALSIHGKVEKTAEKSAENKNYANPGKERAKKQRRVARLEQLVEEAEQKMEELRALLQSPEHATNYVKLTELQEQIEELQQQNEVYMEEWTVLCEELEG